MIKKYGFTLAEVLITIGIIGVVAAMTIPILVNNSQKTEDVAQLKKFYSEFSQAIEQMAADNGCPGDMNCTGIFDVDKGGYQQNSVYVMTELSKYIQTARICGPHAPISYNQSGCFGHDLATNPYKLLNGNIADGSTFYELNTPDRIWATLQNGSFYGLLNFHDGSTPTHCANGVCSSVYVDTNGTKKPNQVGRDVFYFFITDKATLQPATCFTGGASCTNNACDTNHYGQSCSSKILNDSWQMNY